MLQKKNKITELPPKFFPTQTDFRNWLNKNYKTKKELLVGFYKVGSGKPSMTWSQSVDQALCFGWIDGIRKSIDKDSYTIRFTPRRSTSIWSAINISKVKDLKKKGLMQPAGLEAFKLRKEERSGIYSFESETKKLASHLEKKFKANKKAWGFFIKQAPSYQKIIHHWLMTAKQEETKLRRLEKVITASEEAKRLY